MGASPCDTPGVAISIKKGWRYGTVRLAADFLYFLFGFLLGGAIGVGTICCVLCTGPLSQRFRPACDRLFERISQAPEKKIPEKKITEDAENLRMDETAATSEPGKNDENSKITESSKTPNYAE